MFKIVVHHRVENYLKKLPEKKKIKFYNRVIQTFTHFLRFTLYKYLFPKRPAFSPSCGVE